MGGTPLTLALLTLKVLKHSDNYWSPQTWLEDVLSVVIEPPSPKSFVVNMFTVHSKKEHY